MENKEELTIYRLEKIEATQEKFMKWLYIQSIAIVIIALKSGIALFGLI